MMKTLEGFKGLISLVCIRSEHTEKTQSRIPSLTSSEVTHPRNSKNSKPSRKVSEKRVTRNSLLSHGVRQRSNSHTHNAASPPKEGPKRRRSTSPRKSIQTHNVSDSVYFQTRPNEEHNLSLGTENVADVYLVVKDTPMSSQSSHIEDSAI